MASRTLRERMVEAARAAELLSDTGAVLSLAVETMTQTCPHGFALAFTRSANGGIGSGAAALDGELLRRDAMQRPTRPVRTAVSGVKSCRTLPRPDRRR